MYCTLINMISTGTNSALCIGGGRKYLIVQFHFSGFCESRNSHPYILRKGDYLMKFPRPRLLAGVSNFLWVSSGPTRKDWMYLHTSSNLSMLLQAAFMRQHHIEMNWRTKPIRPPRVLKGHDDHVITCLQFSGNRIVSGSDDNTLRVWSATTGKVRNFRI